MQQVTTRATPVALLLLVTLTLGYSQEQGQPSLQSAAADPYEGRFKHGVYSNEFFGFTYRPPKGLHTSLETLDYFAKSKSVKNRDEVVQRLRAELRKQGTLLFASPRVKVDLPSLPFPSSSMTIPVDEPDEFLRIAASEDAALGAPTAADQLSSPVTKWQRVAPSHQAAFSGQAFVRTDYRSEAPTDRPQTASSFLTRRTGYVLVFFFVAADQKHLERMMESMNSLVFTGDSAAAGPSERLAPNPLPPATKPGEGLQDWPVTPPTAADQTGLPKRIRVSQDVSRANVVDIVNPVYPSDAALGRIQGLVVLRVVISKDGRVMKVDLVSGHPMLVPAARDAVLRWSYRPYLLNGEPVEVETQVTINFTLAR